MFLLNNRRNVNTLTLIYALDYCTVIVCMLDNKIVISLLSIRLDPILGGALNAAAKLS